MFAQLMGPRTVSPDVLNQLIQNHQITVFDANSRQNRIKAHVPAQYISIAPTTLTVPLAWSSTAPIPSAANAARRAKQMGYPNVKILSAGITGWQDSKLPTESSQ
jgi:hypothetical protein